MRRILRLPSHSVVVAAAAVFILAAAGAALAAKGDPGTGPPGAVVQTGQWAGKIPNLTPSGADYQFAGPTASVTTNGSQRLTAAANASLGATTPGAFNTAVCTRQGGGPVTPFNNDATIVEATPNAISYGAADSFVPAAGTYSVGFCVRNLFTLDNTGATTGWVMVINN